MEHTEEDRKLDSIIVNAVALKKDAERYQKLKLIARYEEHVDGNTYILANRFVGPSYNAEVTLDEALDNMSLEELTRRL